VTITIAPADTRQMTPATPATSFTSTPDSAAGSEPHAAPAQPRAPVRVGVSAGQSQALHRWIPALLNTASRQLAKAHHSRHVLLDLSAVPAGPSCAPLLALIGLLRRAGGPESRVTATGVNPALTPCLAEGLDQAVTVIDQNGRTWAG
jgi:hypothetical protein